MTRVFSLNALAAATSQEVAVTAARVNTNSTMPSQLINGLSMDTLINSSVSSEIASKEYYRQMMTRYRKNKSGRLSRVGKMALEALQTLRPSVSRVLEQPYLDDTEMGVITGRTILSLVKEGAQRRPGCVLTSHYLIDLLSGQTSTSVDENTCFLNFHTATKSMAHRAIYDLNKVGLLEIESRDNTQLLTPYSERDAGQENLYDWLMTRYLECTNLSSDVIRKQFSTELQKVEKNPYLLDVCYFADAQFGNITGWDLLSLLIESQNQMMGNIPAEAITSFFDSDKKAAVMNGIDDLCKKLGLVDILTSETASDDCYYAVKPFAPMALVFRQKNPHHNVMIGQELFKNFANHVSGNMAGSNMKNFLV